jgi:hypothetical protein
LKVHRGAPKELRDGRQPRDGRSQENRCARRAALESKASAAVWASGRAQASEELAWAEAKLSRQRMRLRSPWAMIRAAAEAADAAEDSTASLALRLELKRRALLQSALLRESRAEQSMRLETLPAQCRVSEAVAEAQPQDAAERWEAAPQAWRRREPRPAQAVAELPERRARQLRAWQLLILRQRP